MESGSIVSRIFDVSASELPSGQNWLTSTVPLTVKTPMVSLHQRRIRSGCYRVGRRLRYRIVRVTPCRGKPGVASTWSGRPVHVEAIRESLSGPRSPQIVAIEVHH